MERATAVWLEAIRTGTVSGVEYRLRSHTGEFRWFLGRSLPIREEPTGPVVRWVGTATDIQHHKELEEERESQARRVHACAEREALLNRIGAAVWASAPPDENQAVALDKLGRALGANRCYLAAIDIPETAWLSPATGPPRG